MEGLTKYGIITEDWGGDVACIPVSALTGMGINDLLERIALEAEVMELKANPNRRAKGAVVEARLDKGQGPIATILVQNGTLHSGDVIIAGTAVGRVRTMRSDKGQLLSDAGPSTPVEITGLTLCPKQATCSRLLRTSVWPVSWPNSALLPPRKSSSPPSRRSRWITCSARWLRTT